MSARRSPESNDGGPPKKKMRQGTHSCIECRRRKIKCIFQADRNGTCNECYARGVSCVDQESAAEAQTLETRQSLRERVANLESLIKVIANKVDLEELTVTVPGAHSTTTPVSSLPPQTPITTKQVIVSTNSDLAPSEAGYERAPIMSIFNNSITTFAPKPVVAAVVYPEHRSKEEKIRQKLLKVMPSDADIEAIWSKCAHWWKVWARMFPEMKYAMESGPAYIKRNSHSDNILALAKAFLCLCLCLQQVDARFVQTQLNLPQSRDDLVQHYVSVIHDDIFSEDRYLLKIEGLEIAVLLAKIDANAGRPRKAWLTERRAISFALLLGLNRKNTWQVTSADPISGPKRRSIFWALWSGDRYFSLILGLPYSLSDSQCDIAAMTDATDLGSVSSKAMYELTSLGGRLIERFQNPESVSLIQTMSYDKQMQDLRKNLPSVEEIRMRAAGSSFGDVYDGCLALLYYNYVRTLLHLPFVLKFSDANCEYSRKMALESAREMISAYRYLRSSAHSEYINCRVLDFQIFLVCLVLIVNAIAFEPFASFKSKSEQAVIEEDWDRVAEVKRLLESAEMGTTGQETVHDSAIQTLNHLMKCKDGCPDDSESAEISIPYFGTITVTPREEVRAAFEKQKQQLLTPSTTLSSCGSPASQPSWQLPTPPISLDSNDSGKHNPYINFDRENIPMPSAYNPNGHGIDPNGDFAFNNSIYMNDMVGSYDWLSMPVSFDTDMGGGWLATQQLNNQDVSNNSTLF